MKILKVKSRNYNGKQYYKYRINLPEELLKEASFKEGDSLEAVEIKKGEIKLKRAQKT
jgi:bifunctional DNA-binding transcriptional regulator/antitoxin component of YhaV-PrlF toxin-antitoxin module